MQSTGCGPRAGRLFQAHLEGGCTQGAAGGGGGMEARPVGRPVWLRDKARASILTQEAGPRSDSAW